MGELLRAFVYPRNALGSSVEDSAAKVQDVLTRAESRDLPELPSGKFMYNRFLDMRNLLAIVAGQYQDPTVTPIGERFRGMARVSHSAAWRWLLTRSLWLYSVPNGSEGDVNKPAKELGIRFNFFDSLVRLTVHLSALPAPQNNLYFDELLAVLDDDGSWSLPSDDLHDRVMAMRSELAIGEPAGHAALLGEQNLEGMYGTGRDNMPTVFRKAVLQTGLFSPVLVGRKFVGIYLNPGAYTDRVLGNRLRFVLDNRRVFVE